MSYQYGNDKYSDFHFKKWSELKKSQKKAFGGTKDDYKAYRESHGLDGYGSAKEKAQAYQFQKKWSDLKDSGYHDLHTKEQHAYHRQLWEDNKGMDWDSTSDAYKMMVDKNMHSTWYKGGNQDTQGGTGGDNTTGTHDNGGGNNAGGGNQNTNGGDDKWEVDWEKLGGKRWKDLSDKKQDKYGSRWEYAAHLMGAPKWKNLSVQHQEKFGDKETYAAWRDNWQAQNRDNDNDDGGGGGGGTTTVVVPGGNSGPTFEQQQQLAREQREYQDRKDREAQERADAQREEDKLWREEQAKKERIQTIMASMSNRGPNQFMGMVGGASGGAQFNSGHVSRERRAWRPR